MRKTRVTVTVEQAALDFAEEQVTRGRAKSISAWVNAAMAEKARREEMAGLLAEMRAEVGPATEEEEEWARRALGL